MNQISELQRVLIVCNIFLLLIGINQFKIGHFLYKINRLNHDFRHEKPPNIS